jgi:hypothetical protein
MNLIKKRTHFALAFFLIPFLVHSQEYKPQFKVANGQEYNYQMDMISESTQSMGGQEMKIPANSTSTIKNLINKIFPDGKIEIIVSSWDAKVSTKMLKDTTMQFNGKVGPTSKITVDKLGNALSKEKIDTVAASAGSFNMDNSMIGTILFCEFPDKPLKTGDKWTKEHTDSVGAPFGKLGMKIKTEYTFGSKEIIDGRNLYKVTSTSAIEVAGKGQMQGMDLFIEGTGAKSGNTYFDPATGVIYLDKNKIELSMTVAISGQQSMTIPVTQKMDITIKLK